jgi:hypothetical protein
LGKHATNVCIKEQRTWGSCSLWLSDAEHNSASRRDKCSEDERLKTQDAQVHLLERGWQKEQRQSFLRTTEVQRFSRRVDSSSSQPASTEWPKSCGEAAKGFAAPAASQELVSESSVLASFPFSHVTIALSCCTCMLYLVEAGAQSCCGAHRNACHGARFLDQGHAVSAPLFRRDWPLRLLVSLRHGTRSKRH